MAKRSTGLTNRRKSKSHKTKKRLEAKRVMLAARKPRQKASRKSRKPKKK